MSQPLTFQLQPRRFVLKVFLLLLCMELLIVFADAFIYYGGIIESRHIRRIFSISKEESLVNWFSSLLFFLLSISFFSVGLRRRVQQLRWRSFDYFVLSLMFLYLSADDAARIHERVGSFVKAYAKETEWNSEFSIIRWIVEVFPSYYWQVVFIPILSVMALAILLLLWRELRSGRLILMLVVALGILACSQGLDYLEGLSDGYRPVRNFTGLDRYTIEHFAKSLEEFLEMSGLTLLLCTVLHLFFQGVEKIEIIMGDS